MCKLRDLARAALRLPGARVLPCACVLALAGCGEPASAPGAAPPAGSGPVPAPEAPSQPYGPIPGRDADWVERALGPADLRILEQGERLVLYSLDPVAVRDGSPSPQAERFHGYGVLGQASIEDVDERRALLTALYAGLEGRNAGPAACFLPRHGLSASNGKERVDLLICFECTWIYVHRDELGEGARHLMGADAEPAFDAALKQHGLPKHGSD